MIGVEQREPSGTQTEGLPWHPCANTGAVCEIGLVGKEPDYSRGAHGTSVGAVDAGFVWGCVASRRNGGMRMTAGLG